jgi:hypothetical protein
MEFSSKTIELMREMWEPEEWAGRVGALIEEAHRKWWYQQRSLQPKAAPKPVGRPRKDPLRRIHDEMGARLLMQLGSDEALEPMRRQLAARIEAEDWDWLQRFEAAAPWQTRWKWAGKEWVDEAT